MSDGENEFEQLMRRLREGDAEAPRELFERYGKAIQMVIRHHLDRRLRSQFDSLDFAQDAWASFFHVPPDRFTFRTPQELVAFLAQVARNKLYDAYRRRFRSAKHGEERVERGLHDVAEQPARQPTPSQAAIAEEEWLRMLDDKPPHVRLALEMLRAGHTRQEIAERLGINPKTIQRVIQHLNNRRRSP